VADESESPAEVSDARVKRAAERLRELEASGITLSEILGGEAGAVFMRDYCDGDADIACAAFVLVHSPGVHTGLVEGRGTV